MPSFKGLVNTLPMIVALSLAGCGVQLGKYTSSGSFFDPLEPDFGIISIDRGTPTLSSSENNQNLIAVVLLCPDLRTRPPSGSSQTNGAFVTTRRFWWTTERGRLDFTYSWNRVTDRINIAGRQFDRSTGNGFLVVRDLAGDWSVRQICCIPLWDDARGILRVFQRKLPNNQLVAQLSVSFEVEKN